ncbi:MAG: HlyC/CorC family transporter, partial [Cyanobacteria bacterium J083]
MNSTEILVRLFSVFLLIALNAFFVAAEFSIVAVRRSRISQLVKAGDASAQTVQSLQKSIDRLLSTTQLGITLSSLALGWIGEKTMAVFVIRLISLSPLPPEVVKTVSHSLAIPVAFLLLAYWQIVLGELVPKSIALSYAEPLAKFFGPASLTISKVFNPIIWVLNQSTKILLSLVGIKYTTELFYNRVSPEELQTIISDQESTGLEAEERALLSQVFEFGEVAAQEVMIPRINMKVIPRDSTFKTLINLVANHGYSRLPVIGESADDIVGMIDFESLALSLATGKIKLEDKIE